MAEFVPKSFDKLFDRFTDAFDKFFTYTNVPGHV